MAKRSRAYTEAKAKIQEGKFYSTAEASALAIDTAGKKTNSTIEVGLKLGVDPRKADQMIRGTVSLPHGTGKVARVIVFANGAAADAAREAGADEVGSDELIARVEAGWTDFDAAVATPDLMGKVGRLGKVLGPRNLMPNPKTGTVTMDTAKAVTDIKAGRIEFRIDKQSNLHFIVGKANFSAENANRKPKRCNGRSCSPEAIDGQGQVPTKGFCSNYFRSRDSIGPVGLLKSS